MLQVLFTGQYAGLRTDINRAKYSTVFYVYASLLFNARNF